MNPLERIKSLGSAIGSASGEIEAIRDLPNSLFEELVARDLFRLVQPAAYGGAELAPLEFMSVIEEAAKSDASTAWCLCQNNVCALITAYLQPSAAQAIFASPRDILAWGPGPGKARVSDGGYVLEGRFNFASGSRHATYLGAHVPIEEANGETRLGDNGRPKIVTLLFPRASAEVADTWQVVGLRGTGSDSFAVRDLFVPEAHSVFRSHSSKKYADGPLYAFSQSNLYSAGFASLALGVARATMTDFLDIVKDTVPRGAPKPRRENNVVQAEVGQAEARIRSCRAWLRGTVAEIWDDVQTTRKVTDEQQVSLRLATTWAIQQSREVVASLYTTAGALAIFESQPFERRFRDIHTVCQQIQGHVAHFETVGQILMGMEPDRSLYTF